MTNTSGNKDSSSSDLTRQSPQSTPPRAPTGTQTLGSRSPPPRTPPPPPAAATRPTQPPPPPMAVAVATALRALMNLTSETGGLSQPTTGDGVLHRPVGRFVLLPTVLPRPTTSPPPPPSMGVAGTTAFRPFKNSPPETGAPGGSGQPTGAGTLRRRIDRLLPPPTSPQPQSPPPPVSPPSPPPMPDLNRLPEPEDD